MTDARGALHSILNAVGAEIGTTLSLDEDGECVIARDDGQEVVITTGAGSDSISLMAPLTDANAGDREGLLAWLMQQNLTNELTQGATIGLDPQSNMLALRYIVGIDGLTGDRLSSMLANLFALADDLIEAIAEKKLETAAPAIPSLAPAATAAEAPIARPWPTDFA